MGKILSYAGRAYEQALTSPNHEMVESLPGVFALAGKDGDRVGKYREGLKVGLRRPLEEVRARARKQWGIYQADISRRMVDMQARRLTDKGLGYNKPMTREQLEERALHQFLLSRGVGPRSPHTANQLEQVTQEHEYSSAGRLPNWEWNLLYGPPNLAGFRAALEYGVSEMAQSPEAALGTGLAQWAGASLEDAIAWGRGVQAVAAPFMGVVGGLVAKGRQARQARALDEPSPRMIEPVTRGTMTQGIDPGHRLTIKASPAPIELPELLGGQPAAEAVPAPAPQAASAPAPAPMPVVPAVPRQPPADVRARARTRAQAFMTRFPKITSGSRDAVTEMFGYTGGWTLDGEGQLFTKIRATSAEQATIVAYHARPSVVAIELLLPGGQVTPDLRVWYANGTSEVIEVTAATGAARGERAIFRDRPAAGTLNPTKPLPTAREPAVGQLTGAIRRKLGGGQLHSPGCVVVAAPFETTIEMVTDAMARTRIAALGNHNLNRIEFHVRTGSGPVLEVTFARSSGFQLPDIRPLLGAE